MSGNHTPRGVTAIRREPRAICAPQVLPPSRAIKPLVIPAEDYDPKTISAPKQGPMGPPSTVPGPQGPPGSALTPYEFAFGVASPVVAYTLAVDSLITSVRLIITQAFNGAGATLSVGIPGQPELFLAVSENDPTMTMSFEVYPDIELPAGTQIVVSINPGASPSQGLATLVVNLLGTI